MKEEVTKQDIEITDLVTLKDIDLNWCGTCGHSEILSEYRELRYCNQNHIYLDRDMLFTCDHYIER